MTDRYAVIGNPIAQSKSPFIHNGFAQASGQDLHYEALLAEPGQFAATLDRFRAEGGRGMNVTAPFKIDAYRYATELSERARVAGAVNALRFSGEQVEAENFDGIGLINDIQHNLGTPLRGKRVLILGAGGAARGTLPILLEQAPAQVLIANRHPDHAQQLIDDVAPGAGVLALGFEALAGEAFDVVLNATSASLRAEPLPLPAGLYRPDALAYELAYGKGLTPFLQHARQDQATRLADGVGMLVEQAAEAFVWWRGVRPPTRPMIEALTVPLV